MVPSRRRADFHVVHLVSAVRHVQQVLAPSFNPRDRAPEPQRRRRDHDLLVVHAALGAEASTDRRRPHHNLCLVEIQGARDFRSDAEDRLRARPHRDARPVRHDDAAIGLHRNRRDAWVHDARATTTSASGHVPPYASGTAPVVAFDPNAGNNRGAPCAIASSARTTAGSCSASTTTRSAASMAWARVSATTTATGSPTKRTRSRASRGRSSAPSPAMALAGGSSRSASVNTAMTPGIARASAVSRPWSSAWATSERTNTAAHAPTVSATSSTYCAPPVRIVGSSDR